MPWRRAPKRAIDALRVLGLFSGIGGFELGLQRAGFTLAGMCENDPFCRSILAQHWPSIPIYPDVRTLRGVKANVVCGGPPCQHTSVAAAIHGRRTGESLWVHMLPVIRDSGCSISIIEQPPGNAEWEAQVTHDLASAGFHVSRHVIAAAALGAPHQRRRVFFIADTDSARLAITRQLIPSEIAVTARATFERNPWHPDDTGNVRVADGVPSQLDRRARITALGNAVVPQIPEAIGRAILAAERAARSS